MKIVKHSNLGWKPIDSHESEGMYLTPLLVIDQELSVVSIRLSPNGVLGMHPAVQDQLFIVVGGSGYVSTSASSPVQVSKGDLILWSSGEQHESRAGSGGLEAIVIEGPELNRALRLLAEY
jgi:quercetin dioxygenase-like cupin family protein